MKKLFIALVFVATGLVANAQLFVGGNIGFSSSNGNQEITTTTTFGNQQDTDINITYDNRVSTFTIAPTVGYMMPDVMGFGATIGFTKKTEKTCTNAEKKEFNDKNMESTFAFTPFFRYVFGDFGKIKLYADAKLPLEFGSSKSKYEVTNNNKTEIKEDKGPKEFGIGFYIQPAFTYQFNEHISFNAELGLLSLGFQHNKNTAKEELDHFESSTVDKDNEFGFGVNTRVPVQFGFVYTF